MDTLIHDAKRFEALSKPIRLMILYLIITYDGSLSVDGLLAVLRANMYLIKQPTLSHHLRILKDAGFVESTHTGNEKFYYVRGEALVYCMDAISMLARGR